MIRWAAVILASLSWIFAFHHHVAEDHLRQWALIAAAVVCGAIGLRNCGDRIRVSPRLLLVLAPIAVMLLFAFPGYRLAPYVVALGLIGLVITSGKTDRTALRSLSLAALFVGVLLLVQSASYGFCTSWTARNPEIPYLGGILHALFSWIGADVSYSGGKLYVRMMRTVHEFPLLWEHVALFPLVQIWLGGVVAIWLGRIGRTFVRAVAVLTASLVIYSIVRLFVLIPVFTTLMLFVDHDAEIVHVDIFWMPWITAVSLLPLFLVLGRVLPWKADASGCALDTTQWDLPKLRWAVAGLTCLACFAATLAVHFWDPGVPKSGRILLDEAHSRWERTDQPYTTDWYGHESGYNYYGMAQYLDHFYRLDFNMSDELTSARLADYDILILKTPTEQYMPAELEAIDEFVRAGGGLLALGEHTNVFGSSVALNPVLRPFAIAFRYDSVFDITRKWEQVYLPGGLRGSRLVDTKLGVHPIMQSVPFFRFAVSCSIATDSWKVRPVIRSTGLWSLPIEYAAGNFYPHVEDTTYARFGAFDQTVCTTADEGRVVAFGDSTVYSNFLAFYPGKPEMLLGMVDWLNRRNRLDWVNPAGRWLCVASLLAAAILIRRLRPDLGYAAAVIGCGAATVWLTMWLCAALAADAYAVPTPHTPVHTVVFDMSHSIDTDRDEAWHGEAWAAVSRQFAFLSADDDRAKTRVAEANWPNTYELPLFAFTKRYAKSFEIFYQWVLRLGYYTNVSFDLDQALAGDGPIVIIEPVRSFSHDTVADIRDYLNRGGSLLVLDSPSNADSTANLLLESFGLSFGEAARGNSIVVPDEQVRICGGMGLRTTRGGTTLLTTSFGEPVLSLVNVGSGQIVAGGLSERFNDARMGGSSRSVPNAETRAVYELEFALMRGLVENAMPQQMRKLATTYRRDAPTEVSIAQPQGESGP